MNAVEPSIQRFRFDRQLWHRFIEIAQPYFYPTHRGSTWIFAGLLLVLLIIVVSLTFFLAVGLTRLGQLLFPAFFADLAGGLVTQVNGLLNSPVPYIALGSLLISGLLFASQRRKLRQRWLQWGLLGLLLFLSFAVNGMNVILSYVFRFIDNVLVDKNETAFWQFLWVYAGVLIVAIPVIVLYRYVRLKLGLFWREWLTKDFLDRYFDNRAYYELDSNAANVEVDNPDQRITEDIKSFTGTTLSFLLDILDSILTLISFIAILWSISRPLTGGLVVYALAGTAIAVIAGTKLIRINYDQLRLEANFRYGMVHVRDNAESIAFYRGESLELQQVLQRLIAALRNFDLLILWQAIIDLFQYGYNYFARLVPYLIVAPLYFAGNADFGTIGQSYFAFSQVLSALSLITNQIQSIASFAASVNRLGMLDEELDQPGLAPHSPDHRIETRIAPRIVIEHLILRTPNSEQTLIEDLSLDMGDVDRLLVVGASGCGKSSLLRAIAGLWTNGQGVITRPDSQEMLFLPQRPYMLLGNLREQLIYPNLRSHISDDEIQEVLHLVNLEGLPERLGGMEAVQDWPSVLSLGEQQRLAFARILLSQPKYVMLDEATSALDVRNERQLYELLRSLDLVYISVGHRPSLLDYHQVVLELGTQTGWRLWSVEEYRSTLA
ncbi:ABC transporter ATP-binding protein/permease [Trichothermofontia sichuanensis B231]|uniref:ABC transporter ATP-binding protein/permease n=1 Tax=Trichothermofontia sichuanensis TaxID=3045816 RepID=UPI002247487A|nr:ABC transporter ATP-binding protein/permease [Trichothermofontia sichuanensis]UZQ55893.1 ABC transporter ATP-binding protein/permease [Trichothermofontia sichuanensis B231]